MMMCFRINLFEIAFLSEEKVKLFKSDFRIVADYFVQMQKNGDYVPDPTEMKHVQEVLQLLNVMTGDSRYEQAYQVNEEGVPRNMCEVLDRIENKGRNEGRSEGLTEGRTEIFILMQKLFDEGRVEDAKRAANDEAFRKEILQEFGLISSVQ